jgi:hypothetical protein
MRQVVCSRLLVLRIDVAALVILVRLLSACGQKDAGPTTEQRTPVPATAIGSFAASFATCGGQLGGASPDFHAAFLNCGVLVGEGACRSAWTAAADSGYPDGLLRIIDACAKQYCNALESKPRACIGPIPEGGEITAWAELHAGIMNTLFGDELLVSPEIVSSYEGLPEKPTAQDFRRILVAVQTVDHAKATLDGRNLVFGLTAKLLGAVFFAPAAELTSQTPIPVH